MNMHYLKSKRSGKILPHTVWFIVGSNSNENIVTWILILIFQVRVRSRTILWILAVSDLWKGKRQAKWVWRSVLVSGIPIISYLPFNNLETGLDVFSLYVIDSVRCSRIRNLRHCHSYQSRNQTNSHAISVYLYICTLVLLPYYVVSRGVRLIAA
jgi:hypothetical protein